MDFLKELDQMSLGEQTQTVRWMLVDHLKYLQPINLPNTDIKMYQHHFINETSHQNLKATELACLLILFIEKDIIWPIHFEKDLEIVDYQPPIFMFSLEINKLPSQIFDVIQYLDIIEASKVLNN